MKPNPEWTTDDPSELPRTYEEAEKLAYQMRMEWRHQDRQRSLPEQVSGALAIAFLKTKLDGGDVVEFPSLGIRIDKNGVIDELQSDSVQQATASSEE
jgi:hypothetical protein